MIEIKNLYKEYSLTDKNKVVALNGIDLTIANSGFVAVVGKSGSGKTTLLNILGGLDEPSSGTVEVDARVLNFKNNKQLDLYRNYTVGFVFQDFNLLEDYSVFENVKLGLKIQGINKEEADERVKVALESVGLAKFEDRKISTLSGGQKQRVAIARALCKDSEVVLCDEPTGNLDSNTSNEIFSLIKSLSDKRVFIVVTHDEESALKYADRIIKISDGKIIEDKVVGASKFVVTEENREVQADKICKKTYGLGVLNSLQMIKHNIFHSLFSGIAMCLLLAVSFTLVSVFVSLSQYDKKDAFISTLRSNQQYILSVTKYVDRVITNPNGEKVCGYYAASEKVLESDADILKADLPKTIGVYPSYYFAKPFSDFKDIELELYSDTGYAYAFKEAIVVDDYSSFHTPLLCGTYPQNDNDILIYEYMAKSLIIQGVFEGDISSLVGRTLTDTVTGLNMRISGILKIRYENYIDIKEDSMNYNFAISYLSGLKNIFCKSAFAVRLTENKEYASIIGCSAVNYNADKEGIIKTGNTKIKRIDSVEDLTFYATAEGFEDNSGIILSKNSLAKMLGITVDDLTYETAKSFIENFNIEFNQIINDVAIYPMSTFGVLNEIIAICNENIDSDGVIKFYSSEERDFFVENYGLFRQIFIGLCNDWDKNKSVIDYFWIPDDKPLEFYVENPEFYDEVFADYDPTGFLIKDVDMYLTNVREFSKIVSYIILGMSLLVVLIYTIISLKKYNYKIGVLKALGAKTLNVILVFGLQMLIISLISFVLSIPLSYLLIGLVNTTFVKDINASLTFFSVTFGSIAIAFAFATIGIILVSGIPLLKLAFTSPTKTIKDSRKL